MVKLGDDVKGFLGFLFLISSVSCYPSELRIGLITYQGLEEADKAFLFAIEEVNANRSVLSQTTLVPEIVRMDSAEDSPSVIIRDVLNLVNRRVSAVIGPFRSSHAKLASYILSELRIPLISPTATDPFLRNKLWSNYLFHLQPLDIYQSQALLDLVGYMDWHSVALISSMDSYGINGLTTFQKDSNERKIKILANEMIPLSKDLDKIDVSQQMENLKNSESRIFIMNVHSGYAKPILKAAAKFGLIGPEYAWIVTAGSVRDAEKLLNKTSGIFDPYIQGMIGFIPSTSTTPLKPNIERALNGGGDNEDGGRKRSDKPNIGIQLQNRGYLTYDAVWVLAHALETLMYTDHLPLNMPQVDFWSTPVRYYNEGMMILSYIQETSFEGISSKIKFDDYGGPVKKQYDLFNFRRDKIFKVASWRPEIGLQMNSSELIMWNGRSTDIPSSTVKSLRGRTLRLGITEEPPFINIDGNCTRANPNDTKCYTGMCIELVEKLAQELKFDYEFVLSEDNKFGSPNPDGTWNGIIKMLLDGKIDVGTVNFAMNKARERAIDFSIPFINTGLVMTTKIKEAKSDPFFWTKPFDVDLWYAILAFAVLMVLLIWLYDHMSPFGFYGRRMHAALRCSCMTCESFRCNKEMAIVPTDEEDTCLFETRLSDPSENKEELMNVGNSLWMVAACLFSIGPVEGVPRNMSGRVILAMWWFMILIVTAMYTANLAAFLTVTRMENGINSITDLISQDEVKWGTLQGSNADILLKAAKEIEFEEVYRRMDSVQTVMEGFRRARQEEYIFFYGGSIVTFESNSKPCDLQIIGEMLFSFGYAFGFPPHSPYLETFNEALLALSEQNELDALWTKWSKGDCASKGKTKKSSSLNLANIYGLCYTFFVIIAVSGIMLIGEILYESVMDIKRFKTSFMNAVKYRLVYIWKRPEYKNCQPLDWQPPEDGSNGSKKTEDMEVKDLIQMTEYDGKSTMKTNDISVKSVSDYVPYSASGDKSNHNFDFQSTGDPDKLILLPDKRHSHNKPNGFPTGGQDPALLQDLYQQARYQPLPQGEARYHTLHPGEARSELAYLPGPHHGKSRSELAYLPGPHHRPYHHNSLPEGHFNRIHSPTDSDSVKRGGRANSYHSSKSVPKARPRNSGQSGGSKKSQGSHADPHGARADPHSARADPHVLAQQLFDRTLERITNNHAEERNPGSKAARTNPRVTSLSTRSSPVYSSDGQDMTMSDTRESSESDVSLPS